jgi:hypothetical protein
MKAGGQARSEAERVAPGERKRSDPALKARYFGLSGLICSCLSQPGATCLALPGTCPRLSYFAPLALCFHFLCKAAFCAFSLLSSNFL